MKRLSAANIIRMFLQQTEQEETPHDEIPLPYEVKEKTVVCGGYPTFINQLKKLLEGDVRYLSQTKIREDLLRNADAVWIQTNAVSHSDYYKITGVCRKYGIPMHYFAYASARKCAGQIAAGEKKNHS